MNPPSNDLRSYLISSMPRSKKKKSMVLNPWYCSTQFLNLPQSTKTYPWADSNERIMSQTVDYFVNLQYPGRFICSCGDFNEMNTNFMYKWCRL